MLIVSFLSCIFYVSTTMTSSYASQLGQDQLLNEQLFKNKKYGVFVDIGAHDGIAFSNTYFFEKELGWTGLCFEPLPHVFERLKNNRTCACINACVGKAEGRAPFICVTGYSEMLSGLLATYDPRHFERLQREVGLYGSSYKIIDIPVHLLENMLKQHGITHIDYLSLDTEGGEFEILQTIDFSLFDISAITVENNYADKRIKELLEKQGFTLVTLLKEYEEVYIKTSLIQEK